MKKENNYSIYCCIARDDWAEGSSYYVLGG